MEPPHCQADWALFLDLDGTVLEIAETPAHVRTSERLLATLRTLRDELGGAVGIVSGRSVAVVDQLLAPLRLPVAGVHGAERRDALGNVHGAPVAPELARV